MSLKVGSDHPSWPAGRSLSWCFPDGPSRRPIWKTCSHHPTWRVVCMAVLTTGEDGPPRGLMWTLQAHALQCMYALHCLLRATNGSLDRAFHFATFAFLRRNNTDNSNENWKHLCFGVQFHSHSAFGVARFYSHFHWLFPSPSRSQPHTACSIS